MSRIRRFAEVATVVMAFATTAIPGPGHDDRAGEGHQPSGNSYPAGFIKVGGTLFFSANDGTHGVELWKHD